MITMVNNCTKRVDTKKRKPYHFISYETVNRIDYQSMEIQNFLKTSSAETQSNKQHFLVKEAKCTMNIDKPDRRENLIVRSPSRRLNLNNKMSDCRSGLGRGVTDLQEQR